MDYKKQREVIFRAVRKASKKGLDRSRPGVAREAARLANDGGVNVQSAPYLHDIFVEALDKAGTSEDQ